MTYSWGLDKGVVGVWQGFGLSNVLLSVLFVGALIFANWDKESQLILKRIQMNDQL